MSDTLTANETSPRSAIDPINTIQSYLLLTIGYLNLANESPDNIRLGTFMPKNEWESFRAQVIHKLQTGKVHNYHEVANKYIGQLLCGLVEPGHLGIGFSLTKPNGLETFNSLNQLIENDDRLFDAFQIHEAIRIAKEASALDVSGRRRSAIYWPHDQKDEN